MEADLPNSVMGILQGITAAADRVVASGDSAARDELDLEVVKTLAADSFTEQDAAEKLVRDALQD